MQPFIISMIVICLHLCVLGKEAVSVPTSRTVLYDGELLPREAVRMWLSRVVLPLPRKPVRTVTGERIA